jgi:hypothetical protein
MRHMIQLLGVVVAGGLLSAQALQQPSVEQTALGPRPAPAIAAQFDGLGVGFEGPQGTATLRNPSDNSLAVGPVHIVQTVNSQMAIFTKRGARFNETGRVLYGPVNTNNVFRGFGGTCEARNNGDAVARYDQLAGRWLIVMPIFSRAAARPDTPGTKRDRSLLDLLRRQHVRRSDGLVLPLRIPPPPLPRLSTAGDLA